MSYIIDVIKKYLHTRIIWKRKCHLIRLLFKYILVNIHLSFSNNQKIWIFQMYYVMKQSSSTYKQGKEGKEANTWGLTLRLNIAYPSLHQKKRTWVTNKGTWVCLLKDKIYFPHVAIISLMIFEAHGISCTIWSTWREWLTSLQRSYFSNNPLFTWIRVGPLQKRLSI
jgi:hypothetical protein